MTFLSLFFGRTLDDGRSSLVPSSLVSEPTYMPPPPVELYTSYPSSRQPVEIDDANRPGVLGSLFNPAPVKLSTPTTMQINGATVASMFLASGNGPQAYSGPIGAWTDAINSGRATIGQLQARLAAFAPRGFPTQDDAMPPVASAGIGGMSPLVLVGLAVAAYFLFFRD